MRRSYHWGKAPRYTCCCLCGGVRFEVTLPFSDGLKRYPARPTR